MSKRMIAVIAATIYMTAAGCLVAIGATRALAVPQHHQLSMVRELKRGYCPLGLVCPNNENPSHPIVSTPGHMMRTVPESGPPYRIAEPGETFWEIAETYLYSGREWTGLCARKRHQPRDLQIGEAVVFC